MQSERVYCCCVAFGLFVSGLFQRFCCLSHSVDIHDKWDDSQFFLDFFQKKHQNEWGFHTARVDCVAWSPDNKYVVSGSLDTNIIVWYMDDPHKHVIVKGNFPGLLI